MRNGKILHLGSASKFVSTHLEMLEEHFDINEHAFYLVDSLATDDFKPKKNATVFKLGSFSIVHYLKISLLMMRSRKIILHGMNDPRLIIILWLMPLILNRTVWVLWGGDLYEYENKNKPIKHKIKEFFKRGVIKKVNIITTTIPEDYSIAVAWYDAKAKYVENLMYKSHIARSVSDNKGKANIKIKIQLGNSATETNQHMMVIDKLINLKDDFVVYCPLSYGDEAYRNKVIKYGKENLKEKFVPILNFMSFEDYNEHMQDIDIAIFNHPRQQAMGNIIGMLSLGKKVYLNSEATPYRYFKDKGFVVGSVEDLPDIELLEEEMAVNNINLAKNKFSDKEMLASWERVFES